MASNSGREISLQWGGLSHPILTDDHCDAAVARIEIELRSLAGKTDLTAPETWAEVAQQLAIAMCPYPAKPGTSRGRLLYSAGKDRWIIEYDETSEQGQQARIIVHELAHWFLRDATPEWLCGEPVVYHYEGSIDDARHAIARRVEDLILG